MQTTPNTLVSLYVVKLANGTYFGGYDAEKGKAIFVSDPCAGKKFSNKNDIKLRPDEMLIELTIDLSKVQVAVSEHFRPQHRIKSTPSKTDSLLLAALKL